MSVKILTAVVLKLECALAQPEHLRAGPALSLIQVLGVDQRLPSHQPPGDAASRPTL